MGDMARNIGKRGGGDEHGFTYLALLILVAIMGVGLAATGEVWSTAMRREKEEQLLFVGGQFRNALTMYYLHTPGRGVRYPMKLEDLLKDPRYPAAKRYLRKIFADPITSSANWELVKGPSGEILGLHSTSEEEPMRKSNFALADQGFEGAKKYSDWVFMMSANNAQANNPQPQVLKPPAFGAPLMYIPTTQGANP